MDGNFDFPSSKDILAVTSIFPDVNHDEIIQDLKLSRSSEATINRILDGTFGQLPTTGVQLPQHNDVPMDSTDEDDDLPATPFLSSSCNNKRQGHWTSCTASATASAISSSKTSSIQRSVKPQYSDNFSDSDDNDIEMLSAARPSSSKPTCTAVRVHVLSDSEDEVSEMPKPLSERLGFNNSAKDHMVSSSESDTENSHFSAVTLTYKTQKYSPEKDITTKRFLDPIDPVPIKQIECKNTAEITTSEFRKPTIIRPKSTSKPSTEKQIIRQKTQQENLDKKKQKDEEKQRKKQEQEEKRRLKEYEKTKQRTLRQAQKAAKPGEATKSITVMIDPLVLLSGAGSILLDLLQKQDITYEIQSQPLPGVVTFWREVTEVVERSPLQLETVKKEVVEPEVLLVLPVADFVQLVYNFKQRQQGLFCDGQTLRGYVAKVKSSLEDRKVTLVIQGVEKYFRDLRTANNQKYRDEVTSLGDDSGTNKSRAKKKKGGTLNMPTVSRLDIEEALVDMQIYAGCNTRFVNSDQEMAKSVYQYTKAVAEAPYKRDRCNTGLSLYVDGSGSVTISKEGHGVQQLWRQQLQQFKNVTAEVANAIIADYKTPLDLYEAYLQCVTTKEAELLLQDIVIRRGVGVMATARRVGKELSRRLYHLLTSDDPDLVLH